MLRPDFQALFKASPGLFFVVIIDLKKECTSDAHLKVTLTRREAIVGCDLSKVLKNDPKNAKGTAMRHLRGSLACVLQDYVSDATSDLAAVIRHVVEFPVELFANLRKTRNLLTCCCLLTDLTERE